MKARDAAHHRARRPDGALETDVMRVLWSSDGPVSPSEVQDRLATGLAYTSVATVLGRLHVKGLVERSSQGRRFVYRHAVTEAELGARSMGAVMDTSSDRRALMTGFVGRLSRRDIDALRAILDELDR